MHHQLTCTLLPCSRGTVARIHLESAASEPVTIILGRNMVVPVLRAEGQYGRQQADWQMSDGYGSDWATIRCGQQVALISWSDGRFVQRSGPLPLTLVHTSLIGSCHAAKMHTHALGRATA
jgi:hypothetical protein